VVRHKDVSFSLFLFAANEASEEKGCVDNQVIQWSLSQFVLHIVNGKAVCT